MNYYDTRQDIRDKPKTWLITGAAGFIGSNLLQELLQLNQTVVGLDNLSTGSRANLDEVEKAVTAQQWERFTFVEEDICDAEVCRSVLQTPSGGVVNYVLHQAALGSVPRSIEDPITTNETNVVGFLQMLDASRQIGVERFVYASSSAVYGDEPRLPKVEDKIGRPLSPYALSKLIDEQYAAVFADVYGFKTIGLRYFNVFGRRQDPNGPYAAVIPKWLAAILHGQPVEIYGDGETSRDFCHISNVVQANLLAATTMNVEAVPQVYNIALGERTTLNELYAVLADGASRLVPEFQRSAPIYRPFRQGDVRHSQADISKAQRLLGYHPTQGLRTGIEEAFPWYLEMARSLGKG